MLTAKDPGPKTRGPRASEYSPIAIRGPAPPKNREKCDDEANSARGFLLAYGAVRAANSSSPRPRLRPSAFRESLRLLRVEADVDLRRT